MVKTCYPLKFDTRDIGVLETKCQQESAMSSCRAKVSDSCRRRNRQSSGSSALLFILFPADEDVCRGLTKIGSIAASVGRPRETQGLPTPGCGEIRTDPYARAPGLHLSAGWDALPNPEHVPAGLATCLNLRLKHATPTWLADVPIRQQRLVHEDVHQPHRHFLYSIPAYYD